jgi:hypothetical protein
VTTPLEATRRNLAAAVNALNDMPTGEIRADVMIAHSAKAQALALIAIGEALIHLAGTTHPEPAPASNPGANECGTIRTTDQWAAQFHGGSTMGANAFPCVLPAGHTGEHADMDGDRFQ